MKKKKKLKKKKKKTKKKNKIRNDILSVFLRFFESKRRLNRKETKNNKSKCFALVRNNREQRERVGGRHRCIK